MVSRMKNSITIVLVLITHSVIT